MSRTLVIPSSVADDLCIRPRRLSEFVGQDKVCENMAVFIEASLSRNEAMDHVILYGPPGLGKTTLASIVASELGVNCRTTAAPLITKAGDLAAILTNLKSKDVLFIDEIHRLPTNVEEVLYSAMEGFTLDIVIGSGPTARSVRLDLNPFTLIGATTRFGMLSGPLRDRFGISFKLDFYPVRDLVTLLMRAALVLNFKIGADGCEEIAKRSRFTPRIALRLLKRVRDFADVQDVSMVEVQFVRVVLEKLGVDPMGLDGDDYRYLLFIFRNYQREPVGLDTIVAALSESKENVEEVVEPYLLQIGFVHRTSRGRVIAEQAIEHLISQDVLR